MWGRVHASGVAALGLVGSVAWLAASTGCESASEPEPSASSIRIAGLEPEVSGQLLAKVGDREIRVGDYAAALQRMDRFERMRYQTKDRREELLEEMINLELLAREAERRGLGEDPETKALLWQSLRTEALAELRAGLPEPSSYSAAEVSEYYDEHRAQFVDPERVRVAHIELATAAEAKATLAEALGSSPQRFAELVARVSHAPDAGVLPSAGDLGAADLGFISRSEPSSVAEALRLAAFELNADGEVLPRVVAVGGRFHVLRRLAHAPRRQRELAEVDGVVRNLIAEQRFEQARTELVAKLRKRTSVVIDEAALAKVPAP